LPEIEGQADDGHLVPAPERPFNRLSTGGAIYHPFAWRGWWDFGTGALGDIACHAMNMSFRALDLRNPATVQAETSGHNRDSFPSWSIISYEFAATTARPALKLFWYDGGKHPKDEVFAGLQGRGGDCLIIGEKGKMLAEGGGPEGFRLSKDLARPEVNFPVSPGHFEEFVRAIRGGAAALSNFPEYAGPLTETALVGNLAVWVANSPGTGPKLEWDAVNQRVKNHEGLEGLVQREYRKGYTL
jgi:predicted dehydrogenase